MRGRAFAAGRACGRGAAAPLPSRKAPHALISAGAPGGRDARCAMSSKLSKKELADLIQTLCVLVVDDNQYMRKMVRNLLVNCGVKDVHEAADGIAAIDAIRTISPHVVILDWEMPLLSGAELVRIVRSPGVFPTPDVPIIMLSAHGERWRVIEAVRLGVNEYLIKPVSAKPRPAVQLGEYYGPEPRKLAAGNIDDIGLGAMTPATALI